MVKTGLSEETYCLPKWQKEHEAAHDIVLSHFFDKAPGPRIDGCQETRST
jgi:hypothetical protein